jgi:hypothetical protein
VLLFSVSFFSLRALKALWALKPLRKTPAKLKKNYKSKQIIPN